MHSIQSFVRHGALVAAVVACVTPFTAGAQARSGVAVAPAECRNCGTVESVTPVQRTARAKGIGGTPVTPGMAIGGVVGGLVGNQVGNGGAATTVLGAAGGAYAGHAIERSRNRYTAYVMRIRMADGSIRTVEQRAALSRGEQVVVEGHSARRASEHHG